MSTFEERVAARKARERKTQRRFNVAILVTVVLLVSVPFGYAAIVGEGDESAAPVETVSPPPPPQGDIPLSDPDAAAASILHGYLQGGSELASFIVKDIQRVTGCSVSYGKLGDITGLRKGFRRDVKLLEERYGDMVGSAIEDSAGLVTVWVCS